MDIDFPILDILDIVYGSAAIMIGLLFLTIKSDNRKANIFLGLFLWSIASQIFGEIITEFYEDEYGRLPMFLFDSILFILLFLLFYIYLTINKSFKWWYSLLFVPGIIHNIFINYYNDNILEDRIEIYFGLFYLLEIFLLVYVFKVLRNHKKQVNDFYSELETKTLWWIKSILIAVLFLHFIFLLQSTLEEGAYLEELLNISSSFLLFFIVYWVGYNGFSQPEIFNSALFLGSSKGHNQLVDERVENLEEQKLFNKISKIILEQKLFTNTELNLRTLSDQLNIKEKTLSKLINKYSKTNFYQFINQFRIEEFKNLIKTPKAQQLSMVGLAHEAGFSSKSTFYTAFKAIEGITPKEYQLKNIS